MEQSATQTQIVRLPLSDWSQARYDPQLILDLEAGKVLYFSNLGFSLSTSELRLLTPALLAPKSRNISLDNTNTLKGALGHSDDIAMLQGLLQRYRSHTQQLLHAILPGYAPHLRFAPTSFRPAQVESRVQSWRADDKRLHVDAFPSRPNRGERILRVFANINPAGQSRHWRVGEPFEAVARRFLPTIKPYKLWQAKALKALHVTKSLRSEYDHLMLHIHDGMKADLAYQENCAQEAVHFMPNTVWVCFSDHTSHAAMSGQYMMEQTVHIAADKLYHPQTSPLATLQTLTGRRLI